MLYGPVSCTSPFRLNLVFSNERGNLKLCGLRTEITLRVVIIWCGRHQAAPADMPQHTQVRGGPLIIQQVVTPDAANDAPDSLVSVE